MNFKSSVIAAALFAASFAASAVGPGNLGAIDNKTTNIGNTFLVGATFSDNYVFDLVNPGETFGSVTFSSKGSFGLSNVVVTLSGGSIVGSALDTDPTAEFGFTGLTAGHYTLNISGKAIGSLGGSYGGVIEAMTAPVPEPTTYALLLAGLGAVGFVARRRKSV
ncbi:FxDxF family PEP-CTERM protein [Roseateles albus]|uniref:FxDxF family PEP-CTERM protein n=1 Tax=Roseateles albus TaxID=2987525 RepID=A0ABT5KJ76_9BURK|nr:FxDxF family PEP-CTERM protein [Roseateles albus]MDC8773920.1 FxDxF family PEP-CTERM protein [Roseateles albus]